MLLEGEHKVAKPWKPGQQMKVDRDSKDSDDAYLKKQLNLEAVVMDEAIKTELKTRWMDRVPTDWLESWWRQINIPAMPGKDMYRSANLLNYHTDEEPSSQTKAQPVGPEVANILENLVKTLVKNAYEKRESIVVEDATMSDEDGEKADEEAAIPKEDRLKFMFRHMHFGHDDDESELGEEHHKVKDHATSISCLFSAFDNKARLRLLGQLVDDPSSKKTVTYGPSGAKPTRGETQKNLPFKVQSKVVSTTDNVDIDMDQPPSSSLPDAFGDIDMPQSLAEVIPPVTLWIWIVRSPFIFVGFVFLSDSLVAITKTIRDIVPDKPQSTRQQPAPSTPKTPALISRSMGGKGKAKAKEVDASSSGQQKRDQPRSIDEEVISPGRRPHVKKRPRLNTAGERPGHVSNQPSSEDSDEDSEGAEEEDDIKLARLTLVQP
ncbi:hypothetical protein JVT61DRAFT_15600 [Boletus reticuloceps]|uniref:Uncharacterized protein n=1 Tax=Boletus reticuloceps TaxID=495285 RepID=A0A8I2YC95_9AGAM|nr:hypothetical protein JVT61DRAFT_15600 [Boletus reticuloceps]